MYITTCYHFLSFQVISVDEVKSRLKPDELEHLEISYDELLSTPNKESFVEKAFLGFPEKFAGTYWQNKTGVFPSAGG